MFTYLFLRQNRVLADTLKNKPILFIEMHGQKQVELVDFLISKKYNLLHVERNEIINFSNAKSIIDGHLYCEYKKSLDCKGSCGAEPLPFCTTISKSSPPVSVAQHSFNVADRIVACEGIAEVSKKTN